MGRRWKGRERDGPEPHSAPSPGTSGPHLDPSLAQTGSQHPGQEASGHHLLLCVGSRQHGSAVHQDSGTLEGRERHWGLWGLGATGPSQVQGIPHVPTSTESPPHPWPWGVRRAHLTQDTTEAEKGEGTCLRSHTGASTWPLGVFWSPN